jgi:hypothetical protein
LNTFGVDETDFPLQKEMEFILSNVFSDDFKRLFWEIMPYICIKKPDMAVDFLSRELVVTVLKNGA